jgi:hypothetical protein
MRIIQGWYSFGQLCLSFVIWLIISSLLSCECIQLSLFRLWDLEIYLVLDLLVCWIKIRARRRISCS